MNNPGFNRTLITGGSGFIGVHLVQLLSSLGYEILNLDIRSPIDSEYLELWKDTSIIDYDNFRRTVLEFDPHFIVHLSAVTTQDAKSLDDFEVNIQGTQNLINIANELMHLKKFIFTSTQYVNTPGYPITENISDFVPYGFYGESKLIGEQLIRNKYINSNWTIIRPTTIWGRWHQILTSGLWNQIYKKRYFHPHGDSAVKSYGYVENTAWQIERLLAIPNNLTDGKIFYLGDGNTNQREWVELFVKRLTNQQMREMPKWLFFLLSEIGEILVKVGIRFPLFRSRYRNLTTSNPAPLDATLSLLGFGPFSQQQAVEITSAWLESQYTNEPKNK